jgi:trehalose 6-phosphate synthase
MSRVVLVSNRVQDLRKAAQAGGVAVALASIVRTQPSLWFGWNGEIKPPRDRCGRARRAHCHRPLSPTEYERFYLGYANSVLWPVFHNRLDLAQFEAGHFEQYGVTRRPRCAAMLFDDIMVHDYLIHWPPLRAGVSIASASIILFPPGNLHGDPEHEQLARGQPPMT